MISVVIPALNEERLIARCLDSLKNQDYQDYEIIVVDNGSTDRTKQIAKAFGVTVVTCHKRGVASARQAGALSSRGEIVVQADADTIYPSDWLSRIARDFSSHPKAIAVAGRYTYLDPPIFAWIEYFFRVFFNVLSILIVRRPVVISGANFAFYRKAFLAIKGYRDCLYADQYEIATRLSQTGKIFYDPWLCVHTSSRRVQKSFAIVLRDCACHILRTTGYVFQPAVLNARTFVLGLWSINNFHKALPVLLIVSFVAYGYFIPTSQVFGKVYYKGKTAEKVVALTFDDGPNEPYTSQILDILKEYDVKATFFVIGKNVEMYPQTANRMVVEGHILGNHSYNHRANHALTDIDGEDIERAQYTIFLFAGVVPYLYRPPHGKKSPTELNFLKSKNLIEITWNVSTNEQHKTAVFGEPVPDQVARHIIGEVKPGYIILLHDGYGAQHNTQKSDRSLIVKALPIIIENLQSRGYQFITVPELLGAPAYN